jgi:hypothetical protein
MKWAIGKYQRFRIAAHSLAPSNLTWITDSVVSFVVQAKHMACSEQSSSNDSASDCFFLTYTRFVAYTQVRNFSASGRSAEGTSPALELHDLAFSLDLRN